MAHLLDLSTDTKEKLLIAIDGKEYALRRSDEMSLVQLAPIDNLGSKISKKGVDEGSQTEAQALELEENLNKYMQLVLENVEAEVVAKLHWSQKLKVMGAFLSNGKTEKKAKEKETATA